MATSKSCAIPPASWPTAAEDQTRPPSQRALGRRGAREQLRSAGETIERMLAAALEG
jgi:hypothetical protein